ncbi:MAG TPA: hypothetical protein VF304_09345 [Casimicrobiaceae bacterium]
MRVAPWVMVMAAVAMALPFGWGLGVFLAYMLAGSSFGQLPAATVPLAIVASLVFALWPSPSPSTRLTVMVAGTVLFFLFARLFA